MLEQKILPSLKMLVWIADVQQSDIFGSLWFQIPVFIHFLFPPRWILESARGLVTQLCVGVTSENISNFSGCFTTCFLLTDNFVSLLQFYIIHRTPDAKNDVAITT